MPSLYCSRCGLRTKLTPALLVLEHCPRCMARSGTVSPLVVSVAARPAGSERREPPTKIAPRPAPPRRAS